MIKLGDLFLTSYSNMVIMDGCSEFININPINPFHIEKIKIINPGILECEVEKLDAIDNRIRVWLKEG